MTRQEKEIAFQTITLLEIFQEETKKDYLKREAERLIRKLERNANK